MSATTDCIRRSGRGRATIHICAKRDLKRKIPGSTGPIPAATPAANCRTAGCWLHADKTARIPEEHSETPYMTRRAMDFITEAEARRPALVPASVLHQAALALHRARALRQHVRAQGRHPRDPLGEGAAGSASGVLRLHGHALLPQHVARRGPRKGHPDLYGPDQADRRPDGRADGIPRRARSARQHHDRVHVGSWRLSRRPLDGREGPVPRSIGQNPADRHRSVARGRIPRAAAYATRWSRASIWRRPSSTISAARRRTISSKAVR